MAILAHPDDEMTIAPILVKYAEEVGPVTLVISTDGPYGTNGFTDHAVRVVAMRNDQSIDTY